MALVKIIQERMENGMKHRERKKVVCRLVGILLSALLLLGEAAPAYAADWTESSGQSEISIQAETTGILQNGDLLKEDTRIRAFAAGDMADSKTLEKAMAAALEKGEKSVDVLELKIPASDEGFFSRFVNNHPQYFYVESCRYWISGNYISRIEFSFTVEEETKRTKMIEEYESKIDHILANIQPAWSDLEKILYIHDYLASNCEYDTTLQKFTAYDAVVGQTAVCQGYSLAFQDLMNRLGISCELVSSNAINHAWNLVKLGKSWYHVDVTWNDATPDRYGRVRHIFLLKSTKWFETPTVESARSHKAPDYVYSGSAGSSSAKDTQFDNCFWNGVESAFGYYDGSWYANESGVLKRYSGSDSGLKAEETLATLKEVWNVWGSSNRYWTNNYGGCIVLGSKLYYATPTNIQSLDLTAADASPVTAFTPSKAELAAGYLYGFTVTPEGKLLYGIGESPNETAAKHTAEFHTHEFGKWNVVKEPTCTEGGKRQQTCNSCGYIKSEKTDAAGHTPSGEATCSEPQVCAVCGKELSEKERHRNTKTKTVAATFKKEGSTTITCKDCGQVVEQKVIPKVACKKNQVYTVGDYKYKIVSAKTDGTGTVNFSGLAKNVKKVKIGNTVTILGVKFKIARVGNHALKNKTSVTSVTIGKNVTAIGKEAFYGAKNLKTITISSTKLTKVEEKALGKISAKAKIVVPATKLSAYKKLLKGKGQAKTVTITKQ